MDARWKRDFVRFEPRAHSWNRRFLAHGGRARLGSAGDSLRGDKLESASGLLAGWFAHGVQLLSGSPMAEPLADACEWRRRISDFVWRLGSDESSLVTG